MCLRTDTCALIPELKSPQCVAGLVHAGPIPEVESSHCVAELEHAELIPEVRALSVWQNWYTLTFYLR